MSNEVLRVLNVRSLGDKKAAEAPCLGAMVLGTLPHTDTNCYITKDEYEETGPSVGLRKGNPLVMPQPPSAVDRHTCHLLQAASCAPGRKLTLLAVRRPQGV